MEVYLPLLKGKRVAVFANQTSMVGHTHLVDTLLRRGVNINVIFGPEHGFRGRASAGETVSSTRDGASGLPVISLYGAKTKPSPADLADVDVMIYDIQDIGARFYTYISSLEQYMEAALENGKPLLILDRPNPNGFYVDGPVLEKKFRSFVGRQPVPVVYGMTPGEYAMMLGGEKWLSPKANDKYAYYLRARNSPDTPFHLLVIKCMGYDHKSKYILPVATSPNIPDMASVYWYPSTCFFEGTVLSEGRGTPRPFCYIGHPLLPSQLFSFRPLPNEGAKSSKHYGETCYGWNLADTEPPSLEGRGQISLHWLLEAYRLFPGKDSFFIRPASAKEEQYHFNRLAGNSLLMDQIKNGVSEAEIRKSWQPGLDAFKRIRKKYLLYTDF
jgi:uncharacterized protein YbbC (DUF1343 family)